MAPAGYSRRQVLVAIGGLTAATAMGFGCAPEPGSGDDPLQELVDGTAGLRRLGAEWLADEGRSRKAEELIQRLREDVGEVREPGVLRPMLARRVESDYAALRMAKVGDWILSETEIALCALAARSRRE